MIILCEKYKAFKMRHVFRPGQILSRPARFRGNLVIRMLILGRGYKIASIEALNANKNRFEI